MYKIKDIEDKIPDITNLATTTAHNAKINEIQNGIHSISNLVTTDVVIKADYDTEIKDIKNKYITISDYDKFKIIHPKIAAKKLVNESGLYEKIKTAKKKKGQIKKSNKGKIESRAR